MQSKFINNSCYLGSKYVAVFTDFRLNEQEELISSLDTFQISCLSSEGMTVAYCVNESIYTWLMLKYGT